MIKAPYSFAWTSMAWDNRFLLGHAAHLDAPYNAGIKMPALLPRPCMSCALQVPAILVLVAERTDQFLMLGIALRNFPVTALAGVVSISRDDISRVSVTLFSYIRVTDPGSAHCIKALLVCLKRIPCSRKHLHSAKEAKELPKNDFPWGINKRRHFRDEQ